MPVRGITVNGVCTGATDTGIPDTFMDAFGNKGNLRDAFMQAVPMGRMGQPVDLPSPSFSVRPTTPSFSRVR